MLANTNHDIFDWAAVMQPETDLERRLLLEPYFTQGLQWGVPRYGHPEGEVYKHVLEVLANIDRLAENERQRTQLRLIAFSHDTFKYIEDKQVPRDWSKHHGILARRFMENHIHDHQLLTIIEWHDEAYYVWRLLHLHQRPVEAAQRLDLLLERLGDALQLYYLFFKCDTLTGDKTLAPLIWFEQSIPGITLRP